MHPNDLVFCVPIVYNSPQLLEFLFGLRKDAAEEIYRVAKAGGDIEAMLTRAVRFIKSILAMRRPGTKDFEPPTPWTAPIPALRPHPLTFEEQVEGDMKELRLTGPMRYILFRAARESGPRGFDLMVALTKHASDRFSYLLALPRHAAAHPNHQETKLRNPNGPVPRTESRESTLRALDILLTRQPLTVPSFRPAIGSGSHSCKRQSPVGPAAVLSLSPSEREASVERTPLKPLEVDNCLMQFHEQFVVKFYEQRVALAAKDRAARRVEAEAREAREAEEYQAARKEEEDRAARKAEEERAARVAEEEKAARITEEECTNPKPENEGSAVGGKEKQEATSGRATWAMVANKGGNQTINIGTEGGPKIIHAWPDDLSRGQGGRRQSRREQGGGGIRWRPEWNRPRRKRTEEGRTSGYAPKGKENADDDSGGKEIEWDV